MSYIQTWKSDLLIWVTFEVGNQTCLYGLHSNLDLRLANMSYIRTWNSRLANMSYIRTWISDLLLWVTFELGNQIC